METVLDAVGAAPAHGTVDAVLARTSITPADVAKLAAAVGARF